ncbi:MAG: DUF2071 domain-containing protein [Phycisphaerales bacterium]|nr:DUF2071 domain-containing protein [Phycisphaerales bacterium]
MNWHDLLFLHWPVDPGSLAASMPPGIQIDTFDGAAYVAVVPFWMSGVRARWLPGVPGHSTLPELNVRTYVRADGFPGVYFLSLDAASRLVVSAARTSYSLRYRSARMRVSRGEDSWIGYSSTRTDRGHPPASFQGRYRPTGPAFRPEPGTLEHWLVERYCLYSVSRRSQWFRAAVHHGPWELRHAEAEVSEETVSRAAGLSLNGAAPLVHYVERMDVVAWRPRAMGKANRG